MASPSSESEMISECWDKVVSIQSFSVGESSLVENLTFLPRPLGPCPVARYCQPSMRGLERLVDLDVSVLPYFGEGFGSASERSGWSDGERILARNPSIHRSNMSWRLARIVNA